MTWRSSSDEPEEDSYLDEAVRRSMRKHGMPSVTYHERSSTSHGSESTTRVYRGFVVTVLSILAAGGIGAAVTLYGDVREMKGDIKALKETVDHVFRLVEPHYRGVPEVPDGTP